MLPPPAALLRPKIMAKTHQISDALLARLHGKGSMSEVLQIERERLLRKSQEEMQRQLSPASEQTDAAARERTTPPTLNEAVAPEHSPPKETLIIPGPAATSGTSHFTDRAESMPPEILPPLHSTPAVDPLGDAPSFRIRVPEYRIGVEIDESARREGLSRASRVVGDDLSDFGPIVRHSPSSVKAKAWPLPPAVQQYYCEVVDPSLPFTAQRSLLTSIQTLTLSWGTLTCQIPLDLLAGAAGIRNLKTLRKWLADLQARKHIRYTPVHGDLRGSLVTITPPSEITSFISQWWKQHPEAILRHTRNANEATRFAG